MSDKRQQVPSRPATPITSVDLAVRSRFYSSTACISWGFVLVVAAVLMIVAGSTTNNDGTANGDLQLLGVIVGVMGSPLLLVGLIAAGVRLGLKEPTKSAVRQAESAPTVRAKFRI